jgi:hypothetical protein
MLELLEQIARASGSGGTARAAGRSLEVDGGNGIGRAG